MEPISILSAEIERGDADPIRDVGQHLRAAHAEAVRLRALCEALASLIHAEAYTDDDPLATLASMTCEQARRCVRDLKESDRAATITAHRLSASMTARVS